MPGFRSDHINLIAANLRDRYKSGFPILKELIQNADDAKARCLVFGYHPGFAGQSAHPLLQGPALWVLNDGEFKESDRRAIQSFGLNSKAGEAGAIGKFGLGMKSVFHLCEAFFYVAFDGRDKYGVILNPWYDSEEEDTFHNRWEQVAEEDFERMHEIAASHRQGEPAKSYLQLWLPLRMRKHVPQLNGKPYGAIIDKFPGDDPTQELAFLYESTLPRRVSSILPLLKKLETLEFAGNDTSPGFALHLKLDSGTRRLDHESHAMIASGIVSERASNKDLLKFYVRQSTQPATLPFPALQRLDSWPKTMRQTEDGTREQVPDKSEAEGAVMISHADADLSELELRWAVFLPTEEGIQTYEASASTGKRRYQIVLHGQFFVDAGRRGIGGFRHLAEPQMGSRLDLDDADLHVAWNQAIAQLVVLPEVLPALSEYVNRHGLTDAEIEEITSLIARAASTEVGGARSSFCHVFRQYLYNRHAWICELLPTGRQWRLLDQDRECLLLQLPPVRAMDLALPWAVMPGLRYIPNAVYCDASASALVPRFDGWDDSRLLSVLQVDIDAGLCDQSGLDYLFVFLSTVGQVFLETQSVQDALVQLIQRGFRTRKLEDFRRVKASFRALVALVKPENRVAVGPMNPAAVGAVDPRILALLFSCETRMLIVPADLDATEVRAAGKPSDEDLGTWLVAIDREICAYPTAEESDAEEGAVRVAALLKAATMLLGLCGPRGDARAQDARARIVRLHRRARILPALDVRTGTEHAESLESLEIIHGTRRLFKQITFSQTADVLDKFGHAKALSLVLNNERVLLISSEIAAFIQQDGHSKVLPADDGKAILEALGTPGRAADLSSFEARRALLKAVHESDVEGDARRGLRYLLHGSPQGFMGDQAQLWIDPGKGDSPWIKLWRAIEPGSWFVLAEKIASDVPPNDWESLGISQVQQWDVLRRLQADIDLSEINGACFSDSERETILAAVEDESVWRRLPLHLDTENSIGSINVDCFRDSGRTIPAQLSEGCRLIRRAQDPDHHNKQSLWIPIWTSETTIRRALESEEPQRHWRLLAGEIGNHEHPHRDALPGLRSVQWLPLANGGVISPEDVIDIEEMADEIDRLSSHCGYPFAGIAGLHADVQSCPEFGTLRQLFSAGVQGLPRFGQLMSEVPGYSVGSLDRIGSDDLAIVAETLSNLPTLPSWAIIAKAIRIFDAETVGDHLLGEVCKPLELSDIKATLLEISRSGADAHHVLSFNFYLRQFVLAGTKCRDEIRQLRLLSKAGSWQDAERLCVGAAGVVKESVLDDTQAKILAGLIFDNSGPTAAVTAAQPVDPSDEFLHGDSLEKLLESYFRPWSEVMPTPPIGAFLCLLGLSARSLGREFLKPHSMPWFTERLGWVDPGQEAEGTWRWMSRMTALDALDSLDPYIKVSSDSQVEVLTITGDLLLVELDSAMDTIFAGAFNWRGGFAVSVTLRSVPNLLDLAPRDLSHLLKRSALYLLQAGYNQRALGISPLWDELEKSDQLSLEVARNLILENLPFYLQQLKVAKRNKTLSEALANLKRLQHEKSEATSNNISPPLSAIEHKVTEAKKHLARLMAEDEDIQRAVLLGVRERVKQSQYEPSSIAFELFQNADDAVSEMQLLHESSGQAVLPSRTIGRFVVEGDGDVLRFIHWGRPINFTGQGVAANPAYQDDLENMLILSASDKDGAQPVTGKFGLGFKSVLLATDSPRILSADLRARIIGGCLPERWTGPEVENALGVLERHRITDGPRLRPTLIELHIDGQDKREEILFRFEAFAGIQAIFSKEIRRISIQGQERNWRPAPLIDNEPSLEVGTIRIPTKNGFTSGRLLVWRGHRAAVAMRLDSRGVDTFDANSSHALPSIWVTGPTRETPATGLILNAHFDLDAGRGALAHGEGAQANLSLVNEIAKDFARDLKIAVQASRDDWETSRGRLGLALDVSAADFWASFWKRAAQTELDDDASQSAELLHRFGMRLLGQFIAFGREIPNGMPRELAAFVERDKISLVVGSRWVSALDALRGWPDLVRTYPVSGWIDEGMAVALEAAEGTSEDSKAPRLSIEFLKSCVPGARCSPETACTLFFVLVHATPVEQYQISNSLSSLMFMAADGSWQLGTDLLKDRYSPEEGLCLSFAPSRNVIHSSYTSTALTFAIERGTRWYGAPTTIANWILQASSPLERKEGLRYLLCGWQSSAVREQLRASLIGTWLDRIEVDSPVLAPFSPDERKQLVAMLNPGVLHFLEPSPELPVPTVLHRAALERIFEWWSEEREEQLPTYEKNFWPDNIPRRFNDVDADRQSWMTLFALGLMQRLGRTRDFQNRGFIDFTDSKGWWPVFCNVRPQENSEAWMDILKGYAEQPNADEKYIRWMDCFASLYRIARWMEAYSHVFLSLDQRSPGQIAGYLAPNEDPVLDGSDIHAPSLRNSLRLGQHLVVRELLRAGVLKSDTARSLAYMPNFRVRTLFAQIGYPMPENGIELSRILREALGERADFFGDFDIPLLVLSGSSELQARVLDLRHDDEEFAAWSGLDEMEMDNESFA
ncbi:hypothetical protein AZOA_39530 [Azoarcus sp. Aa7]|nr:hypothetical protein [Azoarcus sp. Aa7]